MTEKRVLKPNFSFWFLFPSHSPNSLQLTVAAPFQLGAPLDLDPESDVEAPRPSTLQLLPPRWLCLPPLANLPNI
jgi:hypothetical protein